MFEAIAIAIPFMLADRLAGGDYCKAIANWVQWLILDWPLWLQKPIMAVVRMRSVAWATLWLAAALAVEASVFHLGYDLVLFAAGFAGWRWDGWTATGAGINPEGVVQIEQFAERQAFVFVFAPIIVIQRFMFGHEENLVGAAILLTLFVVVATGLGIVLAYFSRWGRDINTYVELARGLALGLSLAIIRLH